MMIKFYNWLTRQGQGLNILISLIIASILGILVFLCAFIAAKILGILCTSIAAVVWFA